MPRHFTAEVIFKGLQNPFKQFWNVRHFKICLTIGQNNNDSLMLSNIQDR